MRKVMAGTLTAVALTWAYGASAADAAKERREAADATKAETKEKARDAQGAVRNEAERTRGDVAAPDARTQPTQDRQARSGQQEKKHPLFEGKNNFDVDGKVAEVSSSSITIQRKELPNAKLHVSHDTKVELDGEKTSVQQLKPGQDVKASFNLQDDKVQAVEIKAKKLEKDDRKEMSEQRRETQQEMQKQQQKQQQQR